MYPEPRLTEGGGERSVFSDNAKKEWKRRRVDRELYGELSRYYPLPEGEKSWKRPPLLLKGKHGRGH